MKKFMALFVTASMLVSMASCAGAVTVGEATPFEFAAQCTDSSTYSDAKDTVLKTTSYAGIYVRHWVTGGSSEYTNHFRGRKAPTSTGTRTNVGAKWCTVGMNVPIQSNSIKSGAYYSVSGRGNTTHYDYDGVSNVTLHGNMYINVK